MTLFSLLPLPQNLHPFILRDIFKPQFKQLSERIGLLLVDKGNARVIKESKESTHDDELWESIKQHF